MRYTKAARTMTQLISLTPDLKAHFERCEFAIGAVLLGRRPPLIVSGKMSHRPPKAFHRDE